MKVPAPITTPDDLSERLLARLARTHTLIAPLKTKQRWDDALSALSGVSTGALLHDKAAAEAHRALLTLLADSGREVEALIVATLEAQEIQSAVPDHLRGLCEDLLALHALEPQQTEELVRQAISHAHLARSVRDDVTARESVGARVDPRLDKMLNALLRLSTSPRSPCAAIASRRVSPGSSKRFEGMQSSPARRRFPASPLGGRRKRSKGGGGYLARGLAARLSPDRRSTSWTTRFVEPLAAGSTVVLGHGRGRVVF